MRTPVTLTTCLLLPILARAIELNLDDPQSIRDAAKTAAEKMVGWYSGKAFTIPGLLPGPYYWWEAGAMFGSLIDYWYYTGDESYNAIVTEALLFQVSNWDFVPFSFLLLFGQVCVCVGCVCCYCWCVPFLGPVRKFASTKSKTEKNDFEISIYTKNMYATKIGRS